jgi:hypothetical protein
MADGINLSEACMPARVYFYIAVFSIIVSLFNGANIIAVAMKVLFALFWFVVLKWLCDKGYENISWFLVLLPYIIIAFIFFKIISDPNMKKQ